MSKISDTLNNTLAAQGKEEDSGLSSLRRDNASKNITLSDWDQLVQGTSVSVSDIKRLYSLLNVIIPIIDDSIASNESRIDAIEPAVEGVVEDVVRKSLGSDSTQNIEGTVSLDKVVSNVAEFYNATVHNTISMDGATQLANDAVETETLRTDYIAANYDNVAKVINILSDISAKAIASSGTISASTIRSSKILPDYTASSVQLGDESIDGFEVQVKGKASVSTDLDVGGNLNVRGKTINQIQESIIVEDNIIVTNSSGAGFSTTGIVMRASPPDKSKPNNPSEAYGILYSPNDKVVMIGKGTLTEIPNVTSGAVTYEFEFAPNEALPLAARDGFDSESEGFVPMWNATQNAFVPSGAKVDANGNFNILQGGEVRTLATESYVNTYVDGQLDDIARILNIINNGGSTGGTE